MVVRGTQPSDPVSERYFGFHSNDIKARNVAVVSGPFTTQRRLSACLFLVQDGVVYQGNSFSLGRSNNQIGSPSWQRLDIKLALGDEPNSSEVILGASGHSSGCSCWNRDQFSILRPGVVSAQVLPGRLDAGKEYIVYVEGDQKFTVDRETSLEDFAKINAGNYLVVSVKWDR